MFVFIDMVIQQVFQSSKNELQAKFEIFFLEASPTLSDLKMYLTTVIVKMERVILLNRNSIT